MILHIYTYSTELWELRLKKSFAKPWLELRKKKRKKDGSISTCIIIPRVWVYTRLRNNNNLVRLYDPAAAAAAGCVIRLDLEFRLCLRRNKKTDRWQKSQTTVGINPLTLDSGRGHCADGINLVGGRCRLQSWRRWSESRPLWIRRHHYIYLQGPF